MGGRVLRLILATALITALPITASGWSNGGSGGNGFGTHDWVIVEAARLAASNGSGWLNTSVATAASDDPDTVLHDTYHHVYDVWGSTYGDAPVHIASTWNDIIAARDAGDYTEASRLFGLMAHYYSDICNPLHTDQTTEEEAMHGPYETAVSASTDSLGENSSWVVGDGLTPVSSPATKAIAAATAAHADYASLVSGYNAGGVSAVTAITTRSLNRAANDLADMIDSLEAGKPVVVTPDKAVERVGGDSRYDVAANLASTLRARRGAPFTDVIVACGEDRAMADPLGAAALASAYECPVLLTPSQTTHRATLNSIAKMRDENGGRINIHVVGGRGSVSPAVYGKLASLRGTGTHERIDAVDRYSLASKMASRVKAIVGEENIPGVLVVNIEEPAAFNDALAAAPLSARAHMPLIGIKRSAPLPGAAKSALALFPGKPRYAVNSARMTSSVMTAAGCTDSMSTSADRLTAATQIARFGVDHGFLTYGNVGLVNKLSDALPAGAMMGQLDGVLLYNGLTPLAPTTGAFVLEIREAASRGWAFGGRASLDDSAVSEFREALNGRVTQRLTNVSASVSNPRPDGGSVSVYVTAKDQYGDPIEGATVMTTWHYKTTSPTQVGYTDSLGVATITRSIGSATPGYTVVVDCGVVFDGVGKRTVTRFTPQ